MVVDIDPNEVPPSAWAEGKAFQCFPPVDKLQLRRSIPHIVTDQWIVSPVFRLKAGAEVLPEGWP